jgi:hypothetical protein
LNPFGIARLGQTQATRPPLLGPRTDVGRTEQCHDVGGEHLMNQGATVWKYELELSAHAISAARARSFVGRRLVEHELQYLADDVQLVVSELATNALTHALGPFTVTLAAVGQSLLVKVRDGSPCHPVIVVGTPLDTTGRGVTIVALLSREWGLTAHADGGKTVWAAFDTRRDLDATLGSSRSVPVP